MNESLNGRGARLCSSHGLLDTLYDVTCVILEGRDDALSFALVHDWDPQDRYSDVHGYPFLTIHAFVRVHGT